MTNNKTESEPGDLDFRLIQEERLSTVKCLQICAELSEHIAQIQSSINVGAQNEIRPKSGNTSEKITHEGLQECKDSLARTARKLEGYEQQIFARLLDRSKALNVSDEERADAARLRDELAATRQGIDICSEAHKQLNQNVSVIDNYARGDAVQFMVSTSEKTIHGKNKGLGWRTRQVGGHISDESLQQIARSLAGVRNETVRVQDDDHGLEMHSNSKTEEQLEENVELKYDRNTSPTSVPLAAGGLSRSCK